MPMNTEDLQQRVDEALQSLTQAEHELAQVLHDIEVTARADKKMIGSSLQTALAKVVAAKATLAALHS